MPSVNAGDHSCRIPLGVLFVVCASVSAVPVARAQSVALVAAGEPDRSVLAHLRRNLGEDAVVRHVPPTWSVENADLSRAGWPEPFVLISDVRGGRVSVLRRADGTLLSRRILEPPHLEDSTYAIALVALELLDLARAAPVRDRQHGATASRTAIHEWSVSLGGALGAITVEHALLLRPVLGVDWSRRSRLSTWSVFVGIDLMPFGRHEFQETLVGDAATSTVRARLDRHEARLRVGASVRLGAVELLGSLQGGLALTSVEAIDLERGERGQDRSLAGILGGRVETRWWIGDRFGVGAGVGGGVLLPPRRYVARQDTVIRDSYVDLLADARLFWRLFP